MMWELIIGVILFFIGGGLIGQLVMYLIKRHDKNRDRYINIVEKTIINLSQYGKSLNKALNILIENYPKITIWLENYVNKSADFNKKARFLNSQYNEVITEAKEYSCLYAEVCPRRLLSVESSPEFTEYCDKVKVLITQLSEREDELRENILKVFNEIESSICIYDDIINHFPEIYSLKRKIRQDIIKRVTAIQTINANIRICIFNIKSDPILNIGKEENRISGKLIEAIKEVEYVKISLTQILN